ncbi:MAG TPA: XRE family transcriptional regulator [Thermomicrobiaceae bacterium]|nr:XRE family transcriptional regulator [Thermomicrobiaceae bacterium]
MTRSNEFARLADAAKADPARRARIDEYKQAIDDALRLAEARTACGLTQAQLAERLRVSQANVSRIEHEQDTYVSTLRDYVAALGGRLEITAVFPDERITIFG